MVYLILFIYLFYLTIAYDVCKKKRNKQEHFITVLLLMILVSGLRYRLGVDTVIYMDEFKDYPTLSQLSSDTFSQFTYTPLWIILNVICRSINSFTILQLLTATLHISIWGYVLKRICPSIMFSALLCYYFFNFLHYNMEAMRESLAVSFFLLAVLALNNGEKIKMIVYIAIASLFHMFAFPISLLFLFYFLFFSNKPILGMLITITSFGFLLANKDFLCTFISNYIENIGPFTDNIIKYTHLTIYKSSEPSLRIMLGTIIRLIFYLGSLVFINSIYSRYVNLTWRIFSSTIWISIILLPYINSMPIVMRVAQYFEFFTTILIIIVLKKILDKMTPYHQIVICSFLITCSALFIIFSKYYSYPEPLTETELFRSRYFPYSSVFDKNLDESREHISSYRY